MKYSGKTIIITTGGGLGDMLTFTPALRRLREKEPEAKIVFMTKFGAHEVMEGLPYIDKLIYIKRGTLFGRYRVLPDFWHADAVVFTDWQPQLLFFSRLFGIALRAGIGRAGKSLDGALTYHIKHNVMQETEYAALTHARMIGESLELTLDDGDMLLDVATPAERHIRRVDELLREVGLEPHEPYIALAPFTSYYKRDWTDAGIKGLMALVKKELGLPLVVVGQGAPDGKKYAYDLTGKTGVMELVELIRRSKALISMDSGPMHIGGALRKPTVALFGKDLPSRWAPIVNTEVICLQKLCSPCTDEVLHGCREPVCITDINAEMVYDKLNLILK